MNTVFPNSSHNNIIEIGPKESCGQIIEHYSLMERTEWARQTRLKFCARDMVLESGEIDQECVLPLIKLAV